MKFTKTILFIALFAIPFFMQDAFAQPGETGQRMRISQGRTVLGTFSANGTSAESGVSTPRLITEAEPLTFESLDAEAPPTVGNRLCQGVTDGNCGWYKAFWIFGDGNYMKFADDVSSLDAASRSILGYRYFQRGVYKPVVYLTEKYHNDNPPEAARANIDINGAAASGTPIEPTVRLATATDRKVDIDYNHSPRPGYPMNFVLSYRRTDPATAVLLYYNALTTPDFSTFTPARLLQYKTSESAFYQTSVFAPQIVEDLAVGSTPPFVFGGPSILDDLNTKFKSRLLYNVANPIAPLTESLTELRVFPVLETYKMVDLPSGVLPPASSPASFVCILIGTDSVLSSDPARGRMIKNANVLFGNNFNGSFSLGGNNPQYIRGIEIMNLSLDASHDPNALVVTDIRDLGNGKFRVTFKLMICNKGSGNETNPTLTFNDLTDGRYTSQPVFGELGGITPGWLGGGAGVSWSANLPGFQITGVPPNYEPSCRELTFSIDTDAEGVARLYQETPRALQVCVKFSGGDGECNPNDMLPSNKFQKEDGKYPLLGEKLPEGKPAPDPKPNGDWLLWALLILVLIGVIAYFYKKQMD
ncbi:MAG: hypothetical protein ACKVT2_08580 [Saprospiraceae bacterium]